jgi:hypothetical protein
VLSISRVGLMRAVGVLCLAGALLLGVHRALSEDIFRVKGSVYDDNRDVFVYVNNVHLEKDLGERLTLSLQQETDAVSSASIGCTVCHPDGGSATHIGWNVGGSYSLDPETNTTVGVSYFGSTEQDYLGNTVSFSAAREFAERNTTLAATYSFSYDNPHPHGWEAFADDYAFQGGSIVRRGGSGAPAKKFDQDVKFQFDGSLIGERVTDETKTSHRGGLSWTQVLDQKTIAQVNVDATRVSGFQSNAYHIVPVAGATYLETHPDARTRRAGVFQLNRALDARTFLKGSYRLYSDTWGITSHTGNGSLGRYFAGKSLLLEAGYRHYTQSAADFHRVDYEAPQAYMTNDDRLGAFQSGAFRAKAVYELGSPSALSMLQHLHVDAAYERYVAENDYQYNLLQLGVSGSF